MGQKVSAVLDETLFERARLESVRQGKPVEDLLGEALELYLNERGGSLEEAGVVARSWAVLKLDHGSLRELLEEEDGFLHA